MQIRGIPVALLKSCIQSYRRQGAMIPVDPSKLVAVQYSARPFKLARSYCTPCVLLELPELAFPPFTLFVPC